MNELTKGCTLQHGKYKIVKTLGRGSFGITYLATTMVALSGGLGKMDVTVNVAIKEFFMEEFNSRSRDGSSVDGTNVSLVKNYRKKFHREAENLGKLKHPNIVKVLEVFDENNTTYYAMEYVEGESLDDYIKSKGRIPQPEVLIQLQEIGAALKHMHDHKMLHLDLKPKNIMRNKDGHLLLIDFGLSKQYTDDGEPESSTKVGAGTPGYAPIEQANYREGKGFPVTMDVYALGGTMFKMLTGIRPPEASDILNEGFPVSELQENGVQDDLIEIIAKAMAPVRKDRYQSIEQFTKLFACINIQNAKRLHNNKQLQKNKYNNEANVDRFMSLVCSTADTPSYEETDVDIRALDCSNRESFHTDILTFNISGVDVKMIKLKAGGFTIGKRGKGYHNPTEPKNPHYVKLSEFYIGETPVTQELWEAVMGHNPSVHKGKQNPVDNVSWYDCQTFINTINCETGLNFRLPTEAEWEYAARGGYPCENMMCSGNNDITPVGWYNKNSTGTTHSVKLKKPNRLGIYDMSGNVNEWCYDWFSEYSKAKEIDPKGPNEGTKKVYRGGSYDAWLWDYDVCNRFEGLYPNTKRSDLGFRLVLSELQSKLRK